MTVTVTVAVAVMVMVVVEVEGASGSDVDGRLSLSSANNIQHSPLYSPHHLCKPSSEREAHSGSRVCVIRARVQVFAGVCAGFVLCISIDIRTLSSLSLSLLIPPLCEEWSFAVHFLVQRTHPAARTCFIPSALLCDYLPIFATLVIELRASMAATGVREELQFIGGHWQLLN